MTKKYEVGGKLRCTSKVLTHFTEGKLYVISSVNEYELSTINGNGDVHHLTYSFVRKHFELVDEGVSVEASPTVIDLLANLSRRLHEAEQTIKTQAYEINELYKAVAANG